MWLEKINNKHLETSGRTAYRIWAPNKSKVGTQSTLCPVVLEPLNSRKTRLLLYKYSFKGKTRTDGDAGAQEENGVGLLKPLLLSYNTAPLFFLHLWSDRSSKRCPCTAKLCPFNNTLAPSLPFFMPFSFLPLPTLLLPLLLLSGCHDNSSTAPFIC